MTGQFSVLTGIPGKSGGKKGKRLLKVLLQRVAKDRRLRHIPGSIEIPKTGGMDRINFDLLCSFACKHAHLHSILNST
ncbi:MAG: hypothetical protein ACE14T_01700 [Syntrophales bacterium]